MIRRNAADRYLFPLSQLLILLFFGMQAHAQSGPVGWWKLDEGSGTTTADSSGNANSGTLLNSPTWITGRVGPGALSFPGTTPSVNVNSSASLNNLYLTGLTVSAWIKASGSGGGGRGRIVDKDNNDSGWFFSMYTASSVVFQSDQFIPSCGTCTAVQPNRISSGSFAANTWVHVVATWDGSLTPSQTFPAGMHLFINGVQSDGTSTTGSGVAGSDSTTPLSLGNRPVDNARGFNGAIDEVRVYNRVLTAAEIAGLADSTVPSQPTALSAVAASSTQINLNWTKSTDNVGVTNYLIERCNGSSCSSFTQVGTSTSTSYSDSGLTASTSYSYRVRATDANSNLSTYSSTITMLTPSGSGPSWTQYTYDDAGRLTRVERDTGITSNYLLDPAGNRKSLLESNGIKPTSPTLSTPTAVSPTQVNLSWSTTNTTGVSGYTISRCPGASCTCTATSCPNFSDVTTITGTPPTTSYSDTSLISATYYGYVVRARDIIGNISDPSNVQTIQTLDGTPPDVAPVLNTATAVSAREVDLTFTQGHDNVGVTGYTIERCVEPALTSCFSLDDPSVSLSYQDTGVVDITQYRYRVRAYDAAQNHSDYSNALIVTTPDGTPPTPNPSGLSATGVSSTQINLAWTGSGDNVGVAYYSIERCLASSCTWAEIKQVNSPSPPSPPPTSYADGSVAPSTSYLYRVRARDAALNWSGYSANATGTSLAGVPSVPTISPTDQQVFTNTFSLVWTASPGATSYKLFSSQTDQAGSYNLLNTYSGTSVTLTNVGLSDHYYEVEACNSVGCSTLSGPAHVLVCSPTNGCP